MTWDCFWNILGNISNILGIGSFIFSIPTYFIAKSLKGKIDYSIDLHDYSNSKPEYIHKIDGYIRSVSDDKVYNLAALFSISETLKTLEARFSNITPETRTEISKVQAIIKSICSKEPFSTNPSERLSLIEELTHLRELLRKEDRNYVQK